MKTMKEAVKREWTFADYFDKVYGGWFGKCLGGAAGARCEGIKHRISSQMRDLMDKDIPNDDLDIQLLWLTVLEEKGPDLTSEDLADAWLAHCWYPFGEYGYFRKNYARGIAPPYSGWFNNAYFKEGMGCPIRSEIWAMIHPGDPERAAKAAQRDGCLDHQGESCWAEQFLAAVESLAFVESNIPALIREGLTYIREDCRVKRCIEMVLRRFEAGEGFEEIAAEIVRDYTHPDFTNSPQNMGYVTLALLFGGRDMEKVVNLALSCGYDADCTCASAASVVGIVLGYAAIPDDLKVLLQDRFICGIDVHRPDDTLYTLALNTCQVGTAVCLADGVVIREVPEGLSLPRWPASGKALRLKVEYLGQPAIGYGDACPVRIIVQNRTRMEQRGVVNLSNLPEGFETDIRDAAVTIPPEGEAAVEGNVLTRPGGFELWQSNILKAVFGGEDGTQAEKSFGVAGATEWRVAGPFVEEHNDVPDVRFPPCHPDNSSLPGLEALFSNMALPQKEYLDEAAYVREGRAASGERLITAYEDLIPVDETFGAIGEATFYLTAEWVFTEEAERWIVIGNSDAFVLWLNGREVIRRDECRCWQPHCHAEIVTFKKGVNRVALKLTRRTEKLRFSLGIRCYEGKHYHQMPWDTHYACKKQNL